MATLPCCNADEVREELALISAERRRMAGETVSAESQERYQNRLDSLDEWQRDLEAQLAELEAGAPVLGTCPHGVDLDRAFCSEGCRV